MVVDLQRSFSTLLLPGLLLLLVYLLHTPLSQELERLGLIYNTLPYALFTLGMLFSLLFRLGREFFNLLVLVLTYLALNHFIWSPQFALLDKEVLFKLLCLLVPLNLLLNDLLRDRGILNRYGLQRLLIIGLQIGGIFWISLFNPYWLNSAMNVLTNMLTFSTYTPIPSLALLTILLAGVTLLIYTFTHPATLQSALLIVFVTLILALHSVDNPVLTRLYFMLTGLVSVIALVQNSHFLAYRDELTQLPSRRALRQQLMELGPQYTLAMVDVDHFKKLNDKYGHDTGDQVLRMLAGHLRKTKGAKTFRYGGEEFTLVFPGKLSEEVLPVLEQLRTAVATDSFKLRHKSRPAKRPDSVPQKADAPSLQISISIGLADSQDDDTHQQVMKLSDQALYQAKKKGRNRVVTAS